MKGHFPQRLPRPKIVRQLKLSPSEPVPKKVIDWLGTVMAGWVASDNHDEAYRDPLAKKGSADIRLLTNMVHGSISNLTQSNGLLRTAVGLVLSPIYYGAVAVGGGPAFRAGHANGH